MRNYYRAEDLTRETREAERKTVRSGDLTTRERVNFVLSTAVMQELRRKSEEEKIPMSRIIDMALQNYFNKSGAITSTNLEKGVTLYHQLELSVYDDYNSSLVRQTIDVLETYFKHFTYSSCLLKNPLNGGVIVGMKSILYISDDENAKLSEFFCAINKLRGEKYIRIVLDGQPINL